jgi:hypothetical protein
MAKTFKNMAAQGDFIIMRVKDFPEMKKLEKIESVNNRFVVAHSETGHDHVMVLDRPDDVVAYKERDVKDVDLYQMFFDVKEPTQIEHLRSFDTHDALTVSPGRYMIRRQREYTPEGFRKAAD